MEARKLFAVIVILLFSVMMQPYLPASYTAAAPPDIIVSGAAATPAALYEGADFTLQITFKNISADDLSNIILDFSSSNDIIVKSGSSIVQYPSSPLLSGDSGTISVSMRYTGSSGNDWIPFKFIYSYSDGTSAETSTGIYVNAAASLTPGPEPDTSKYKPSIQITVLNDTVTAGTASEITLLISNLSLYYSARNVSLQSVPPADSPVTSVSFPVAPYIQEILPGTSHELKIAVTTDKYASGGVYRLPITLSFSNIWNDSFVLDTDMNIVIVNPFSPGSVLLDSLQTAPEAVKAGTAFSAAFQVRNPGSFPLRDITLTVEGMSQESFTLASGSNITSINTLEGGSSRTVTLDLRASAAMKAGSYPLDIRIVYSDEKGNVTSTAQQLWIPVEEPESGEGAADLVFVSLDQSKTEIGPGEDFTVRAVIRNGGDYPTEQVKVSAEVNAAFLYPVLQDTYYFQKIQPGESKTLTFRFQAPDSALRGLSPVVVKAESSDGKGGAVNLVQSLSVFQTGSPDEEDPSKNIPKIIIKSYSTDPSSVKAGEKFKLNIEFWNTHNQKTIYNIRASFYVTESSSETGNVFSPVDSSNTIYIDSISPKETVSSEINLYTITDAKSKTYTVSFAFEYQDEAGNPYRSEEIIGIPVYQPARFELSEPYFPPEVQPGQPFYIYFEMYNMGKNILYNVKLRVEGVESEPKNAYYGNFEAGHNEYVELNIIPYEPGTNTVSIIVSYENANGELNETVSEYSFNVAEYYEPDPNEGGWPDDGGILPPDGEGSEKGGFFRGTAFKVIAGIIALAAVAVIIVVRAKKHNNGKEIDI